MSKTKGRKLSAHDSHADQAIDEQSETALKAISSLRELVKGEKDLVVRMDDLFMLRYLRGTNFDPKQAFCKMQTFYKTKATYPGWYAHAPVQMHKDLLERHIQVILPGKDRAGRRIYVVKNRNIDTSTSTAQTVSQLDDLWLEAIANEPETQRNGTAVIMDMAGYPLKMLTWLTPSNLRAGTRRAESVPFKIIHHVVNTSMVMNAVVALVFPFLSAATKESIYFHYHDRESLHKHIDPSNLPKEYGGTQPDIDYEEQQKTLLYDQKDLIWEALQLGYEVPK